MALSKIGARFSVSPGAFVVWLQGFLLVLYDASLPGAIGASRLHCSRATRLGTYCDGPLGGRRSGH
eukprot:2489320-Amphidinium_carterae.1